MSGYYKQAFYMPFGELTVVAVDQGVFDDCVYGLAGVFNVAAAAGDRLVDVAALCSAGHIPLIKRGSKTDFLFERFDISGDMMSLVRQRLP